MRFFCSHPTASIETLNYNFDVIQKHTPTMERARPAIDCTFEVMTSCESNLPEEAQRRACVEGARDAHLQVEPTPPPEHVDAYRIGWNTALLGCPLQSAAHLVPPWK